MKVVSSLKTLKKEIEIAKLLDEEAVCMLLTKKIQDLKPGKVNQLNEL